MKRLYRIWMIHSLVICILWVGILILIDINRGRDIDLVRYVISGFIFIAIIMLFRVLSYRSVFSKIKYLENNDIAKPSIKGSSSSVIDLPQGVDFSGLKKEIANKWMITFSDDTSYVLKFMRKMSFFNSTIRGAAGWLKLDCEAGKIQLECFPMTGIQDEGFASWLRMEIEDMFEPNEMNEST